MMTGIPTVSELLVLLYGVLTWICILGFAIYDYFKKRVSDRALAFFCPIAFASPFVHASVPLSWQELFFAGACSLTGAAAGFGILLAAALSSKSGTGIGGGDIKLAALIGFIYGPSQTTFILLIASGLAAITALTLNRKHLGTYLALPFVPFLAAGSFAVTAASIMQIGEI